MTQQYLRALSLVVGNDSQAKDLSKLHVRFEVKSVTVQTLKTLECRIYNTTDDLAAQIANEFTAVKLNAGYEGNIAQIFSGSVTMVRFGKETADTTFVDIQAQDGDLAFNWGVSTWALRKGYTPDDVWKKCLSDLAPFGISEGYRPAQFVGGPATGAMPVHAQTRDVLRDFAKSQGCAWFIEDGRLNLLPIKGVLPGFVPKIGAAYGMVGTPQQTTGGLIVRTLLNPVIKAGSKIELDSSSNVSQLTLTSKYQTPAVVPSSDPRGYYKAFQVIHTGDSRGNIWYTDCICAAVDGTAPLTSNFTEAVTEDGQ